ncbi:hypothetical protein E2C01_069756 [Portunus trituberculatus]|uniref:Uncharacterized protein n=1 Tax=Portunus trituberculatus TaxID=210409 RepID=A0A5B7HSE1_PORTR|nr:hypothetical protein [Portunus trituberculatus]
MSCQAMKRGRCCPRSDRIFNGGDPGRQAERYHFPWVWEAQTPLRAEGAVAGSKGGAAGAAFTLSHEGCTGGLDFEGEVFLALVQHVVLARVRRLERYCGGAGPQEDRCRIIEVRREMGGAGGVYTRKNDLEIRHCLLQRRSKGQEVSAGNRCNELARKP